MGDYIDGRMYVMIEGYVVMHLYYYVWWGPSTNMTIFHRYGASCMKESSDVEIMAFPQF